MSRFNCGGKPIFDELFREAINKWAKTKGINPKDVYMANGWSAGEEVSDMKVLINCPPIPLSMIVRNPINTAAFEEAIIIEE